MSVKIAISSDSHAVLSFSHPMPSINNTYSQSSI